MNQTEHSRTREHVETCEECRTFVQLHGLLNNQEDQILERPSTETISSCLAIPRSVKPTVRRIKGVLTYDSWSNRPAAALRDYPIGQVRYLTWKIGEFKVELVGHREHNGWQFTARAYHKSKVSSECSLQVGRRHLLPGAQGFMMWKLKNPPRRLQLNSGGKAFELELAKW